MCEEAAQAGTYDYNGVQYPRMRFLTVAEVLEDRREFHVPTKVNTRIATGRPETADPSTRARLAAHFRDALSRLRLSPGDAARRWNVSARTVERLCSDQADHPVIQRRLAAALADAELRQLVPGPDGCPDVRAALRPHLERLREAAERAGWDRDRIEQALREGFGTADP